jgi:HSP20 family protein
MPGLTKEDIKVNFLDGKVTISADKGEKKYRTELPVDHELDEESVKATYTNGILELKFKLKPLTKQKTKEVKIA